MIASITQRLFADIPQDTLYHYTSFAGLLGIVDSGELRASDIRYMNDSAELRHTLDLMRHHITERMAAGTDAPGVLNRLLEWLSHRIVSGPMLFCASFRANGNLLSQWRGYAVHGKGVSLGFDPLRICECVEAQGFQVGKCLYEPRRQNTLIEQIVDAVEARCRRTEAAALGSDIFEDIEADLLRIAAILKHPSFEEEQEWRLVSPMVVNSENQPIHFREGASMLVPYYAFDLTGNSAARLVLDHVYLGPTNNIDLSMNSLTLYLTRHGVRPRRGIDYCQIPYRQR